MMELKLFENMLFYEPMIMVNMTDKKRFMYNLLNNKHGPLIPISFITDSNHELMKLAESHKPHPSLTVEGLVIVVSYKVPYKA